MEIYGVTTILTFSRQDHIAHTPPLDWFLNHRLYLRSGRILDPRLLHRLLRPWNLHAQPPRQLPFPSG
ncbi:hypothetical protein AHAS_Ahas13G0376700 [Arachis hypogaea]